MKKPIILLISCLFSLSAIAQITNAGLEEWEDRSPFTYKFPVGWSDGLNITKSSDAHSGNYSCELKSFTNHDDMYCVLHSVFFVDKITPPKYLSFYYRAQAYSHSPGLVVFSRLRYNYSSVPYEEAKILIETEQTASDWQKVVIAYDDAVTSDLAEFWGIEIQVQFWDGDNGIVDGFARVDDFEIHDSYPTDGEIIKPVFDEHFLAGKKDTIKWKGCPPDKDLKVHYSLDNGNTYTEIAEVSPGDTGMYIWDVLDTLSTKCKVKLTYADSGETFAESDKFLIKPYVLTRLESNGDLTEYNNLTDAWSFENDKDDVWPERYYYQFDYLGFDPLTNLPFDTTFIDALPEDFPSWKNFTGAFSVGKCYDNLTTGIYNQKASTFWKSKKHPFRGACFGIAASNALAFESKNDFLSNFPDFGAFAQPAFVTPNNGTVGAVAELYTHQYGNPSIYNDIAGNGLKTPTQTVKDIRKMFSTAHTEIRTLTMFRTSGNGAHTILPYKLEQDTTNEQYYYIYVYDNSKPDIIDGLIRVDASANGGAGSWEPLYGWPQYGGTSKLYLEIPSTYYYVNATLKKAANYYSLLDSLIEISPNDSAYIHIVDKDGNTNGFTGGQLLEEIPGAHALVNKDGSESPPYSYLVPAGEYTINISNPESETAEGYIFTKDQLFYYERKNAPPEQTDRLIYDGSLTAINPDVENRNIKMMLILEQEDEEDVFKLQPFHLEADDSVKVESPDNNHVILSNYGSAKEYGVELNHVSYSGYERFVNDSIPIKANTSHIFDINWTDVKESVLVVYVDEGMEGINEDTLRLNQHITGVEENLNSRLLVELNLKVWPNPTRDNLTINYNLNKSSKLSISIFDSDGKQVMSQLNQLRQAPGNQIMHLDLSNLPAGIYYYRIEINAQPVYGKIMKL